MTFASLNNIDTARRNLSFFVITKAHNIAKQIGFGYVDAPNAPECFAELKTAYNIAKSSGMALPVWNGASDKTVYNNPGANYAFRFWHDILHCMTNKGFSTAEEIAIGAMHVKAVQDEFGPHSLESLLMYGDTIGQSIYAMSHNGAFPEDQFEWIKAQLPGYIARLNESHESTESRVIEMA